LGTPDCIRTVSTDTNGLVLLFGAGYHGDDGITEKQTQNLKCSLLFQNTHDETLGCSNARPGFNSANDAAQMVS